MGEFYKAVVFACRMRAAKHQALAVMVTRGGTWAGLSVEELRGLVGSHREGGCMRECLRCERLSMEVQCGCGRQNTKRSNNRDRASVDGAVLWREDICVYAVRSERLPWKQWCTRGAKHQAQRRQ